MIILRQRRFTRISEFTSYWKLPVSDEIKKEFTEGEIEKPYIKLESTDEYGRNYAEMKIAYKDKIDALKKSIKEGHICDDGNIPDANTHFISEMSKRGKHLLFTKDIDSTETHRGQHRLTYQVYPIEVTPVKEKDSEEIYFMLVQRVVLQTCKGHKFHGKGLYSEIAEEN